MKVFIEGGWGGKVLAEEKDCSRQRPSSLGGESKGSHVDDLLFLQGMEKAPVADSGTGLIEAIPD